jgi:hypothetical protein
MDRQVKVYGPKLYKEQGREYRITAEVRHDDSCKNGHNSFAITGSIYERISGDRWRDYAGGCLHKEIVKHFPELSQYIKWHLTSEDGPMHYEANTLYWLGFSGYCDGKHNSPPNLAFARSTAVWPDMPESFLAANGGDKAKIAQELRVRLAGLLDNFRADVESLGLKYGD